MDHSSGPEENPQECRMEDQAGMHLCVRRLHQASVNGTSGLRTVLGPYNAVTVRTGLRFEEFFTPINLGWVQLKYFSLKFCMKVFIDSPVRLIEPVFRHVLDMCLDMRCS